MGGHARDPVNKRGMQGHNILTAGCCVAYKGSPVLETKKMFSTSCSILIWHCFGHASMLGYSIFLCFRYILDPLLLAVVLPAGEELMQTKEGEMFFLCTTNKGGDGRYLCEGML